MLKYDQRGVSASKDDVHAAIKHLDKGLYPNAFCKILPDVAANDPAYCTLLHADTAGTKGSLAYLYWRETGDLSVWPGIVQDAIVMNLDDMACVGCVDDIMLSSTVGRNKNLIPGEVLSAIIGAASDFADAMREQGVTLHLAGGETADVGDIVRTIDVGFTAFARMRRADVIDNQIQPGDVIVGLASYGKASYEQEYNGGMGSNGLTAARHDVLLHDYAAKYPESFDPALPDSVVYTGKHRLEEKIQIPAAPEILMPEAVETTVGKLILSPTRTYLPLMRLILKELRPYIHGLIHCTGGGQTKVAKFAQNVRIIKDNLFPVPPLFQLIQESSGTPWREMYQVFNMGHRMEIYLPAEYAQTVIDLAESFNIGAKIIGRVEAGTGVSVQVREFEY
jgi:phosphoribosylformylglycinamidine cyclo-ligase